MRKLSILIVLVLAIGLMGCPPTKTVRPETVEETFVLVNAALTEANFAHKQATDELTLLVQAGVVPLADAKKAKGFLDDASKKLDEAGAALDLAMAATDIKEALRVQDDLVPMARSVLRQGIIILIKYQGTTGGTQ